MSPTAAPRTVRLLVTGRVVTPGEPTPLVFHVNDHVRFISDHGDVTIQLDTPNGFDRSSFSSLGPPLIATTPGRFVLHCRVRLPDGSTVGWPDDPNSGTDVVVEGTL